MMVHKLVVKRPFFSDPHKSLDYNAGFEAGFQKGVEAGRKQAERTIQQFKQWTDLQDKLTKKGKVNE